MKLLRQTSITTRLSLVLLCGLLFAHALSFALLFYERYEAASSMLMANIEHDVVVAVHMLDRVPPADVQRIARYYWVQAITLRSSP